MSIIIDRRLNDRKRSAVNRERFIRRYKQHIKQAVSDMVSERSIRDMEHGGDVKIPVRDISEPTFRHGQGGDRETVHPGNHRFNPGDRIPRPEGGQGRGKGDQGGEGDGQDSFTFSLSREEFMEIFFDDLELPHLIRTQVGDIVEYKMQRAGYTRQGSPTNLSVPRSLRNALGRRIALAGTPRRELIELEARLAALGLDDDGDTDGAATATKTPISPSGSNSRRGSPNCASGSAGCRSSTTSTCATVIASPSPGRSARRRCSA